MKKICLFLFMFLSIPVFNAESKFSEWSTVKPTLENITLETEERYLYYNLIEKDIEYLKYEDYLLSDKENIDYNLYNYSEYYTSLDKVESNEHKEVIINEEVVNEKYGLVKYIKISNEYTEATNSFTIRDISFTDLKNTLNIGYETVEEYNVIHNEDESITFNHDGYIVFKLDNQYEAINVINNFVLLRNEEEIDTKYFNIYYYEENEENSFEIILDSEYDYNLLIPFSFKVFDEGLTTFNFSFDKVIETYLVRDKLYKCFNYEKEEIGYYKDLEGDYLKENEPVLFYRYKVNEDEEDKNLKEEVKSPSKEKEENVIEYTYEYYYEYPLNYVDDIKEYKVYEDEKEEIKQPEENNIEFLSASKEKVEDKELSFFKIFFAVSYFSIIVLLIVLVLSKLFMKQKNTTYVE